ncbi:hypothetical protein B8W69_26955 [Mycobacterium vulneris]|uniref:DUF1508 domain-containing protein n=1 Tax=Mycolicibacterium vulneris TaxID=547163 RepID=A0A1X2KKD0_9MYCO|nr:hypothetical protein [Mycolicibacterium vulneris]OSC22095.1 hypothetical protein B8W69_26955 [Mycolicibacterium vulneris]
MPDESPSAYAEGDVWRWRCTDPRTGQQRDSVSPYASEPAAITAGRSTLANATQLLSRRR